MFTIKPHQIERVGDGQFGTHWSYKCALHKIEECYKEGFFDQASGNLVPGDTVIILEMAKDVVTSTSSFMIVAKNGRTVVARPLSMHITRFHMKREEEPTPEKEKREEFIKGSGEVKWNPGKKTHEVLINEKVVESFKNKDEAIAFARGDSPVMENAK